MSTATVASLIHENGCVSGPTREREFLAIRESGYRLNAVAQGLRRQRTMTPGHIIHGILVNPFFAEVAIGVEHAAAEEGYNVLLFNARDDVNYTDVAVMISALPILALVLVAQRRIVAGMTSGALR